jgi:drug/metabolite transporter (DMT)-like permease
VQAKGRSEGRVEAWSLAVAVTVIWGASFVATRIAVAEVPPLVLAFVRFAIASAVLAPWIRRDLTRVRGDRAARRDLVWIGVTGVTLAFVFENLGLARTTASHGSLIVATTPLATAAVEAAVRRRLPPWRTITGLAIALAGVMLLIGRPTADGATAVGDLLMLCTVGVWVVYSFLVARVAARYPVNTVTNVSILWGVVTLLPLAAAEAAVVGVRWPSAPALASIAFLGVMCSALAYLWWNRALHVLGVTAVNSLIYAVPLVAVAAGVVVLGEPVTPNLVAGGLMIVGGVALANLRTTRRLPGG